MKKLFIVLAAVMISASFLNAQSNSMVFYYGEVPDSMYLWPWGYVVDPVAAPGTGYIPGTDALKWVTSANDGWQGVFIGTNSNEGNDLSSIWATDSVHFKLRAPSGLAATDTLIVYLYDPRNNDWDFSVYCLVENFHDINDGNWHNFSLPLTDFVNYNHDINKSEIVAVSFEAPIEGYGIASEFYIDHVWIGNPNLSINMAIFNGQALANGIEFESWGFENNSFLLAENEGFLEGTPAILWETANWEWQGKGFIFPTQDFTYSWTVDSVKLKVKAPAGIANLALEFYDVDYYSTYAVARKVLDDVVWDGEWQSLKIALSDFNVDGSFDISQIYEFGIIAAADSIPERILIDDIWIGNPYINTDFVAPPAPENITADLTNPYYNLISWTDIETESAETYDVYASLNPISDIMGEGVFVIAVNAAEEEVVLHNIYYPLEDAEVSYFYAVTCTDAAGNVSETFTASDEFTNTGKKRSIINYGAPASFVADGYFDEWAGIMPFNLNPERNLYWGTIDDSLDFSLNCWVAMDNENIYVAFDVYDDVFSWEQSNQADWWEDESIEFFFGLYELGIPHPFFYSGAEPDYRLVFKPYEIELYNGETIAAGTSNYYFEPLGVSDYVLEAKIPFSQIQAEDDSTFVPVEGMTIPFEIFACDADVSDGGSEARLQFGDNPALNPWGSGPEVWTFAWVGMPEFTDIGQDDPSVIYSYYLGENYPNPFNPSTKIEYVIAKPDQVTFNIYNVLGQKVAALVNAYQTAGNYTVDFNATGLSSGVYFYELSTKDFTQIKKMLLVK